MPDKELSIVACASDTIKQLNRDACSILFNEKLNFKGIVVTDGIGSNENVQKASRFAVDFIKEEFEKFHCIEQVIFDEAFKDLKSEFNKAFGSEVSNHHFGTTIISAIEYVVEGKRRIRFAFLGNGAIWHIKGNFNHFLDLQQIPWNSINYLNPHSVLEGGREVLSNCISLDDKNYSGPSTIDISCDTEFGDIIMICTDGIYSNDQVVHFEDSFGETWVQYSERIKLFFLELSTFFKQRNYQDKILEGMLRGYLAKLNENNLMEDDATIGIIVTPKAIEYQKRLNDEKKNFD